MNEVGKSYQLEALTRTNLNDLRNALGWKHWKAGGWVTRLLFSDPAQKFARQMIQFDQAVESQGLQGGSRLTLPQFSHGLNVHGLEAVPTSGSLLVLSNHPGIADSLALFSSLPRTDLRVIANDRPFLRAMPAVSNRMIYVPEDPVHRLKVIRKAILVLRAGGAILTYPAGQIEPDPAVLPGAEESLVGWSESIGIFVRAVPQLAIVGAVVSHVLAPQATYHPLTRLRRDKKDRESLGASIQLVANTLFPKLWPVQAEITYTPPLLASSLAGLHEAREITRAVVEFIRPYLRAASTADRIAETDTTPADAKGSG